MRGIFNYLQLFLSIPQFKSSRLFLYQAFHFSIVLSSSVSSVVLSQLRRFKSSS